MTFRAGQPVVCVGDFERWPWEFAVAERTIGRVPLVPQRGAIYRVTIEYKCAYTGELFLCLAEEASGLGYRACWFRPLVEGEAELERLKAIVARTPSAPAPARERELEEVCGRMTPEGASGAAREAPSPALQAAPPLGPGRAAAAPRLLRRFAPRNDEGAA